MLLGADQQDFACDFIFRVGLTQSINCLFGSFWFFRMKTKQIPHFYFPFLLSHILVYLFYFCHVSFFLNWDRSIINKQSYG